MCCGKNDLLPRNVPTRDVGLRFASEKSRTLMRAEANLSSGGPVFAGRTRNDRYLGFARIGTGETKTPPALLPVVVILGVILLGRA